MKTVLEFFRINKVSSNLPVFRADVAELVDAQVSEACELTLVMVRFHSSAPIFFYRCFKKRRKFSVNPEFPPFFDS